MKSPSVLIRVIRGGYLFLLLGLGAASAADLTIVRVFTGWRDAASFKHISEYFSGKESTHGETMLRTKPDERGGYYFLVRTANPGAPLAVKVNILLSMPGEPKPRAHTFAAELPSGKAVLNLGLTGADWPDAKTNPVAWKLDVLAPDGRVLATEKSYLWEKPATN
ncbi:MAG: hypothetical protein PSV13_17390 [Lacunisphaera sp.]|nr:hypothetical protein [Lacunisphaera sp.]